ncbi:MAG: type I DNA topoisomerase [Candidatus Liptonbacteria bacterium]
MELIIVESPTKAKTISGFLKSGYKVESSYGHVRDLPKSKLGIDLENDFEPQYIVPVKSKKKVGELKKLVAKADKVILATDEDREGEAIAWHLTQALGLANSAELIADSKEANHQPSAISHRPVERIVFHEITKRAIQEALEHPREIDLCLVNAQQARRVLDRIVGYKLSPFLWRKVQRGLSAGRVQSVALRLIADREEEIQKFQNQEYWSLFAKLKSGEGEFQAELYRIGEKNLDKLELGNEALVKKIISDLEGASFRITEVERKETAKNPMPPFTTSTLQQAAAQRLGFSAGRTMRTAQRLYENGFITYMRTDSVNLAAEALKSGRAWIKENLGPKYLPDTPRHFKNKSRLAQEAHEAVRPTQPALTPEKFGGEPEEVKLYNLIWRRFIACQMNPAVFDAVRAEVLSEKNGVVPHRLKANGNTLKFDGFLKIWQTKFEENELPPLRENSVAELREWLPEQHFTQPPARFNEASLIKTLEQYGIGRPSTYAPIIYVIQARGYVEKQQGRFFPTEIGTLVNKVMTENFSEIVDIQFTAKMEEELDNIAEGKREWRGVIKEFYDPFAKNLEGKYETVVKRDLIDEKTDQVCEKCGKPMIIKLGRFGKFMACSGYPECKNTKSLKDPPKPTGIFCPKCKLTRSPAPEGATDGKQGELVEKAVSRKGRARGKIFWGCNRYPDCDYATWTDPTRVPPEYDPIKEAEAKTAREERKKKYASRGKKNSPS